MKKFIHVLVTGLIIGFIFAPIVAYASALVEPTSCGEEYMHPHGGFSLPYAEMEDGHLELKTFLWGQPNPTDITLFSFDANCQLQFIASTSYRYDLAEGHTIGWKFFADDLVQYWDFTTNTPLSRYFSVAGVDATNGYVLRGNQGDLLLFSGKGFLPGPGKNPVLILPGIMGTELFDHEEKLWPDGLRMLTGINDRFMDGLGFDGNGNALNNDITTRAVVTKELTFNYSLDFVVGMENNGYVPGDTLFTFPYDWRKDIKDVANDNLTGQIDYITNQLGHAKVDIVAHSMGGLVLKQLLLDRPEYAEKIGKVVLLGVPNLGAPKATKALIYGDTMGVELLGLGLDPEELKRIGLNMPGVYQLMPSEKYFDYAAGYLALQRGNPPQTIIYDTFESTKEVLSNTLNPQLVERAADFHSSQLDDFDFSGLGIEAFNIAGCEQPTIAAILDKGRGKHAISWGPGDETVTIWSSSHINGTENYFITGQDVTHGTMMSADDSRNLIIDLLLHGDQTIPNPKIITSSGLCNFNGHAFAVHSPVDVHVTSSSSGHTGPNTFGGADLEIPGVVYTTIGEEKFVFVPDSCADCEVTLKGTGDGVFDFNADTYEDNVLKETKYFRDVPVSPQLLGKVDEHNENLVLDDNGDGQDDRVVAPSGSAAQESAADLLPPVVSDSLVGDFGETNNFRSNVQVGLTAQDQAQSSVTPSGVLNIHYSLDHAAFTDFTAPFLVSNEGPHSLEFFATDNVGNHSQVMTENFVIDKQAPEVQIQFSPALLDVSVSVPDDSTVSDLGNIVTATDSSGNVTKLTFAEKDRKLSLKAEITSISYNGVSANVTPNKFKYSWEKKGSSLTSLTLEFKSKHGTKESCVWTAKTKQTKCTGSVAKTLAGFKFPAVQTQVGALKLVWP